MSQWGTFRAMDRLEIPGRFTEVMEVLRPAFEGPGLTDRFAPGDVLSRLTDERWQLFVFESEGRITTACLTCVDVYPRTKCLRIVAVAGRGFQHWKSWFSKIGEWAGELGCSQIIFDGRTGWARVIPGSICLGMSFAVSVDDAMAYTFAEAKRVAS